MILPVEALVLGEATRYLARVSALIAAFSRHELAAVGAVLEHARADERTIFIVGNGGSAATAAHFANDLSIGARVAGAKPIRALSLVDNVASLTALANDRCYERVFVDQLEVLFRPGDVLLAISASGNSANVVGAVNFVNAHDGTTIGLVGFDGGRLKALCHHVIHVETAVGEYGPVEDLHLMVTHLLTCSLRASGCQAGVVADAQPNSDAATVATRRARTQASRF